MYAPNLPEPWVIAEIERQRRIRESQLDERPAIPLPLPMPPAPPATRRPDEPEAGAGRTVIVIDFG